MELVTAEKLLDELHIDGSPEEIATMGSLISDASALIRGSIADDATEEELLAVSGNVFNRLVSSLASKMYYERDLSSGYGAGIQIMLNQLRARYLGGK